MENDIVRLIQLIRKLETEVAKKAVGKILSTLIRSLISENVKSARVYNPEYSSCPIPSKRLINLVKDGKKLQAVREYKIENDCSLMAAKSMIEWAMCYLGEGY